MFVAENLNLPLLPPEPKTKHKDQFCVLSITLSKEQQ
jgi:hypothetical protein